MDGLAMHKSFHTRSSTYMRNGSKNMNGCNIIVERLRFEGRILVKVQGPIEPPDFAAIPRIRELIKTLPDEVRICPEHGEEVEIQEGPSSPNVDGVAPFKKASWVGCCDQAIDRAIEGVHRTSDLIDRAKQNYKDRLAMKLEPEHTGDIVAIELGTGDYFVGEDEIEAAGRARLAGHAGLLYFLRVGSLYTHRLMTPHY